MSVKVNKSPRRITFWVNCNVKIEDSTLLHSFERVRLKKHIVCRIMAYFEREFHGHIVVVIEVVFFILLLPLYIFNRKAEHLLGQMYSERWMVRPERRYKIIKPSK